MTLLKRITINLSLIFFSLIITLIFLEIALRIIYPAEERGWINIHQADESLGWAYVPNSKQWYTSPGEFRTYLETNANAQRDEPRSYQTPPNTYRIMMTGDSFVASLQTPLKDTFVKVTENRLNDKANLFAPESSKLGASNLVLTNMQIEVLNGGTGGYGTDQTLRWFRQSGIKYNPDVVLLVVFLGNDIADNDFELWALAGSIAPPKPFFILEDGELVDKGRIGISTEISGDQTFNILAVRRFLYKHSQLFSFISSMLPRLEGHPTFQAMMRLLGMGGSGKSYNHTYDIFTESPPSQWERAWQLTEKLILTMKEEVEANNASFQVVLIPHPVQVHQDWWQARLALYPAMSETEWDLTYPNTRLSHLCEDNYIPYLDLQPLLVDYVHDTQSYIYYRSDGHFTPEGNHVVGEMIADWLRETLP